jgi:hypothetical protein
MLPILGLVAKLVEMQGDDQMPALKTWKVKPVEST